MPLVELMSYMELHNYGMAGVSDGYHHYRQQNPVAMNSFLLVINADVLKPLLKPLNIWEKKFKKRDIQKYFRVPVITHFKNNWINTSGRRRA